MYPQVPWIQDPKIFDIRTRPRAIPTVTGTKDLQVSLHLLPLSLPSSYLSAPFTAPSSLDPLWCHDAKLPPLG